MLFRCVLVFPSTRRARRNRHVLVCTRSSGSTLARPCPVSVLRTSYSYTQDGIPLLSSGWSRMSSNHCKAGRLNHRWKRQSSCESRLAWCAVANANAWPIFSVEQLNEGIAGRLASSSCSVCPSSRPFASKETKRRRHAKRCDVMSPRHHLWLWKTRTALAGNLEATRYPPLPGLADAACLPHTARVSLPLGGSVPGNGYS